MDAILIFKPIVEIAWQNLLRDLVDFKNTLSEKISDTESLLLQQSRIQAEIQESLMRTRLVPVLTYICRVCNVLYVRPHQL